MLITSFVSHRRQAERFICTAPAQATAASSSPSTPPTLTNEDPCTRPSSLIVTGMRLLTAQSTIVQYHAAGGLHSGLSDRGFYKVKDKITGNKITLCNPSGACSSPIDLTGQTNSANFFTISDGKIDVQPLLRAPSTH